MSLLQMINKTKRKIKRMSKLHLIVYKMTNQKINPNPKKSQQALYPKVFFNQFLFNVLLITEYNFIF